MSVTTRKSLSILSQSATHLRVRSASCSRLQHDGRHLVANRNSFPTNSEHLKQFSTADQEQSRSIRNTIQSSVKEWVHYLLRKPTIDFQVVSRVLSPLNIDLPKLTSWSRLNWFRMKATAVTAAKLEEGHNRDDEVHSEVINLPAESKDVSTYKPSETDGKLMKKKMPIFESSVTHNSAEHDFAELMLKTHESVGKFQSERKKVGENPESGPSIVTQPAVIKDDPKQPLVMMKPSQGMPESKSMAAQAYATASSAIDATSNMVKHIASYLPSVGTQSNKSEESEKPANKESLETLRKRLLNVTSKEQFPVSRPSTDTKRMLVAKSSIDRRTRALVICLREAKSSISQLVRLDELCRHLAQHPESRMVAVKVKVIPCLLRLKFSKEAALRDSATEALTLMGYTDPLKRRGIRILTLDGGGTRGLISIEILKKLEEITQQRIHELFDYVCGVSTGALIAVMATAFRVPLDDTEQVYKEFSSQMFARNKLVGAGKLFMSHAYYDTGLWETILKENIGMKTFLETVRDPDCPKVSTVSTLMNVARVQNFIFRNYNLLPERQSHYAGSINHCLWEAIRASSAAPGYYEEFQLGDHVHQDGGLLTNNPASIAIHECQLLWPNETLQCVVSIGTGRHEIIEEMETVTKSSSLKAKVAKVIQSATDTEAVHTVLHDLLKPSTYFRFNPYMSEDFQMDEIRPEKWDQMKQDTEMYCRKNQLQMELAAQRLVQPRPVHKKVSDWLDLRAALITGSL